jgi:hypothetical protein
MRRSTFTLLIVLAALAAALLGRDSANAVSGATEPALHPMDSSALTLRGTGFKRGEHVRVLVVERTRASKSVNASTGGTFVATFAGVSQNRCTGFSATAVGSDGSHASYKRAPGMCPVE